MQTKLKRTQSGMTTDRWTLKDSQVIPLAENMETPVIPEASLASLDIFEARTLSN